VVATVAGDDVTVGDLAQLKAQYMQMLGGQMSLAQLGGDQRLLDGLIRDRVVTAEAVRLSLGASEAEVSERIFKQYSDASGKFLFTDASGKPIFKVQGKRHRHSRRLAEIRTQRCRFDREREAGSLCYGQRARFGR